MLDVFLCHAAADSSVANALAARMERTCEARVWLEETGGHTVAELWDGGTSSAAIILLLSPDSAPGRVGRADWEALLAHVQQRAEPPVACVLVRDCAYPKLLERSNFFRWDGGTLRKIQRWVMSLHAERQERFAPAPQPWFENRDAKMAELFAALVDDCGAVVLEGGGKTSLAQEFARLAGDYFRDILWVDCAGRSRVAVLGDLASQLGVPLAPGGDGLLQAIEPHRLLVIFDDLNHEIEIPRGRASVLIAGKVAAAPAIELAARMDELPEVPDELESRRLWQAMAFCGPGAFPLDLPSRMAEIQAGDSLFAAGLARRFDARRARLSAASRAAARATADAAVWRRRHAEVVHRGFSRWRSDASRCPDYLAELPAALHWAVENNWTLATELALRAFAYLRAERRVLEGGEVLQTLRAAALERGDLRVVESCDWDLSWIGDPTAETPYLPASPVEGRQLRLFV